MNWHLNFHVFDVQNQQQKTDTLRRFWKWDGGRGRGRVWGKTQPINLDNQTIINQFFICRFEKNVCGKKSAPFTLRCYVPEKVFIVLFLNQWDWTQIPNLKKIPLLAGCEISIEMLFAFERRRFNTFKMFSSWRSTKRWGVSNADKKQTDAENDRKPLGFFLNKNMSLLMYALVWND